jgi:diguanylate cyclase (GGDEF)-like protein
LPPAVLTAPPARADQLAVTIAATEPMRTLRGFLEKRGRAGGNESLREIRDAARRERLLDMEQRLRRYRAMCFAILGVGLVALAPELGWGWLLPLVLGFVGFGVADRFMRESAHPAVWIATAWGLTPLLLAGAVLSTGGAASPGLMWFALPAVTLGARFEPRGIAIGTAYILALLLLCTYGLDPAAAAADHPAVIATATLVLCTVTLSGALVESDRAHRRRSTVDPLTGLLNRNALEQRLAELDSRSHGGREASHALLLCDLDHFKRVNDRLGHAAGDTVLQEVAHTMRASLRAGDSIYRIGGEEILVVLPGATKVDAVAIAERLRLAVRNLHPVGLRMTVSIGAAVSRPGGFDVDDVVRRADEALYAAKANGRDTVFFGAN